MENIYTLRFVGLHFLSDEKSLLYLGQSVGRSVGQSVGLQNEIYLDKTHGSKHLNEKCIL